MLWETAKNADYDPEEDTRHRTTFIDPPERARRGWIPSNALRIASKEADPQLEVTWAM
jgi:hypothetical protein